MTILGKILVVFVLIFTVVTGALIIKVWVTRTNWRNEYETAVNQIRVSEASRKAEQEAARRDKENYDKELAQATKQVADQKVEITGLNSQIADSKRQRDDVAARSAAELANNQAHTNEMDKLKKERDMDKQLIAQQNAEIVRLNKSNATYRDEAVQAKISRDQAVERNQKLALLTEQQARDLLDFKNRGLVASSAKRPPAVEVKGKQEQGKQAHGALRAASAGRRCYIVARILSRARHALRPRLPAP